MKKETKAIIDVFSQDNGYLRAQHIFDDLHMNGEGNPETILEVFEELPDREKFFMATKVNSIISQYKNRKLLLRFFSICFDCPSFQHFDRDDAISRNFISAGFRVQYNEFYIPVRIVDAGKELCC